MSPAIKEDYTHAATVNQLRREFDAKIAAPQIIALLTPVVESHLALHRVNEEAFLHLTTALRKNGQSQDYRTLVERAYDIAPHSVTVAREKINILAQAGNNEGIHCVIDKLEELSDRKDLAILARAQQYRLEGKLSTAYETLETFIQSGQPCDVALYYETGVLARSHNGDLEKSIACFKQALAIDPSFSNAKINYIVALSEHAKCLFETDAETAMDFRDRQRPIAQCRNVSVEPGRQPFDIGQRRHFVAHVLRSRRWASISVRIACIRAAAPAKVSAPTRAITARVIACARS